MTRRGLLRGFATAGRLILAGFHGLRLPAFCDGLKGRPQKNRFLGRIDMGQGHIPMETLLDQGLDGRLYSHLSSISPENLITPTQKFCVRTRASKFLGDQQSWIAKVSALIPKPAEISVADFRKLATPMGPHLMECSGNVRLGHFGMLGVATASTSLKLVVKCCVSMYSDGSHKGITLDNIGHRQTQLGSPLPISLASIKGTGSGNDMTRRKETEHLS